MTCSNSFLHLTCLFQTYWIHTIFVLTYIIACQNLFQKVKLNVYLGYFDNEHDYHDKE